MNKNLKRVAVVIITLILVYIGLRIYLNHLLKSVLIEQVVEFADKNYQLKLGNITIGWWAYNAHISGIKVSKTATSEQNTDRFYFTAEASHIKLRGLYLFELLFYQRLELNRLEITDPKINIIYNDTLPPPLKTDSSFIALKYKLSRIELNNANITIVTSSGANINFSSKRMAYIFKQKELLLDHLKFDGRKNNLGELELKCDLNKASLKGFDLNALFNESTFSYQAFDMDSIYVNLMANRALSSDIYADSILSAKPITKSPLHISPIKIKNIQFEFNSLSSSIKASAGNFNYGEQQLELEQIIMAIRQKHLIEVNVDELTIKGFNADEMIQNKHTSIGKIVITKPQIKMNLNHQEDFQLLQKKQHNTLALKIDSILDFEIKKGSLTLQHHTQKNLKLSINAIDFKAQSFNPNYSENTIDSRLVRNLKLQIGATELNLPTNLYHLSIAGLIYNLSNEGLTMNTISVIPNYDKNKFHAVVKKQIAMINLDLKTLSAKGINVNDLINNNRFWCNEINVQKLHVNFYKDKNIPLLESDYKKFPQELLRELNYPILIKNLTIKDGVIVSEILNVGAKSIAQLKVDQVNANFTHIDNQLYKGNQLDVYFEGRLAGAGLLKATARLDMYASNYNHTVHAELGTMPFNYMNNFMQDFAGVEINTGVLDKAVIDIKGNNKKLNCKLDLSYHDLNMDILKNQDKHNKSYRNVASLLANALIYNHNPERGKPLRTSVVTQEYISNKFIVGNWIAVSLKAMLLTTAPKAASALQIDNYKEQEGKTDTIKAPNLLNRIIGRKKVN